MSSELAGRFLVIGGYGAVGRAVSNELRLAGGSVLVVSRTGGDECEEVVGDIRDAETRTTIVNQGPFRGIVFAQRFRDSNEWIPQVDAMLASPVELVSSLVNFGMLRDASVVFISSNAAEYAVPRVAMSYSATRGAINALARQLVYEFAEFGVRFNVVSFTTILKPNTGGQFHVDLEAQPRFTRTARLTPARRLATTADIAGIVRFLLSAKAEMINGQNLVVDGGISVMSAEAALEEGNK
jgi:NAD(P)-dependent dehydrogenase (short-subunit alcohol dehydrogenase family)